MADNVTYYHQLDQTVDEIQTALNFLTKNGKIDANYMLVSTGTGGVQFVPKIRSGDAYLNINSDTGLITLNYGALTTQVTNTVINSAAIQKTENLEVKYNNAVNYANSSAYSSKYPSVYFLAEFIAAATASATSHVKDVTSTYKTVKAIIDAFKLNKFTSSVIYSTAVTSDGNGEQLSTPCPCIFMQAGAGSQENNPIGLMILYGNTWVWIQGKVGSSAQSITVSNTANYQLDRLATKDDLTSAITGALTQEY